MGWRDVEKGVEDGSISFAPKPKKRNVLDSINDGLSLYLDLNKDEIDASIAKKLEIASTIKEKEKADAAALQLAKSAMTTLGYDPSNTKLRQTIFQMAVGGNFTNLNALTEYVEKYGPTPSATPSKLSNDVGTAGGGRARRNNNPGNLKYVGQKGATKGEDGFAVFPTPFDGMKAMRRQLFLDVSPQGRNLNLTDFITKYAPPSDNNDTAAYIAFVAKEMGIGETDNISGDQLTALQTAMIKMEAGNDAVYFLGGPEPEIQTDNLEETQEDGSKWGSKTGTAFKGSATYYTIDGRSVVVRDKATNDTYDKDPNWSIEKPASATAFKSKTFYKTLDNGQVEEITVDNQGDFDYYKDPKNGYSPVKITGQPDEFTPVIFYRDNNDGTTTQFTAKSQAEYDQYNEDKTYTREKTTGTPKVIKTGADVLRAVTDLTKAEGAEASLNLMPYNTDEEKTAKDNALKELEALKARLLAQELKNAKLKAAAAVNLIEAQGTADSQNEPFTMLTYDENTGKAVATQVRYDGEVYTEFGTNKVIPYNSDNQTLMQTDKADLFTKIYNDEVSKAAGKQTDASIAAMRIINLRETVVANPAVLNKYLQGVGSLADKSKALITAFNTVTNNNSISNEQTEKAFVEEMLSNFTELNDDELIFQSDLLAAAYQIAKLRGSTGQALSNKELDAVLATLGATTTDSKTFIKLMDTTLIKEMKAAELQRKGLFDSVLKINGAEDSLLSTSALGSSIDQYLLNTLDESTKAIYEQITTGKTTEKKVAPDQSEDLGTLSSPLTTALTIGFLKSVPNQEFVYRRFDDGSVKKYKNTYYKKVATNE